MAAPWVALYQHVNFGGNNICFLGTGLVNLTYSNWAYQTSSINIGANGRFEDDRGERLAFYYGLRVSDLRPMGWNERIKWVFIYN
jgi:hypothetical protein